MRGDGRSVERPRVRCPLGAVRYPGHSAAPAPPLPVTRCATACRRRPRSAPGQRLLIAEIRVLSCPGCGAVRSIPGIRSAAGSGQRNPSQKAYGGGCSALRVRGCAGRGRQRAEPPRASRGSAAQREPGTAPSDPRASEVGGKPAAPGKVFKANRKGVANRSPTGATRGCAPLPVTPRREGDSPFTKCFLRGAVSPCLWEPCPGHTANPLGTSKE